jgi:bacteriorhodopsin
MIVEPQMLEALKKSVSATSSVAPIPTVVPGVDPIYQKAGDVGNRTLWVVTVIMALSSLAFYGMAFRQPVQKRLFHILTAFITTFAFLSYFAMASGDGINLNKIVVTESHKHVPDTHQIIYREVYWARYVDWSVTTPLLLLDLCLLAGLSGANILVAIVADVIMILTGLFAAYGDHEGQKWGWYTWACLAFLVIVYQLAFNGRTAVANKDSKTKAFYGAIAGFTLILWTVYPIIWGIADGARLVSLDAEIISYAVLDVLAKPVFGFWLLFTHDSMSSTSPSLEGFWSNGFGSQGQLRVGDDDEA